MINTIALSEQPTVRLFSPPTSSGKTLFAMPSRSGTLRSLPSTSRAAARCSARAVHFLHITGEVVRLLVASGAPPTYLLKDESSASWYGHACALSIPHV